MASLEAKAQAALTVAKFTRGFSGAELANVVNEAALLAGRKGAQARLLQTQMLSAGAWPGQLLLAVLSQSAGSGLRPCSS